MGNAVSEATVDSLFAAVSEENDGGIDKLQDILVEGMLRETRNDKGETALMAAAGKKNVKTMRHLLHEDSLPTEVSLVEYVNMTVPSTNQSALFYAVTGGSADAVQMLASAGATLNHRDARGATALFLAAFQGKDDLIDLLLRLGVDPLFPMAGGATILHCASQQGHAGSVKVIVQSLTSAPDRLALLVNAKKDKDQATSLHLAAQSGHSYVVEVLLACRADDKAKTANGYTPLHFAVLKGRTAAVESLCRLGSAEALTMPTPEGLTPSELAERLGNRAVAGFISDCIKQRGNGGELPASPMQGGAEVEAPASASSSADASKEEVSAASTAAPNQAEVKAPASSTSPPAQPAAATPSPSTSTSASTPAPPSTTAAEGAGKAQQASTAAMAEAMAKAPIFAKGNRVILNIDLLPSVNTQQELLQLERGQLYRNGDVIRIKL